MTPDTKHRERPPFSADWSDEWNRAWISPYGEIHPLTHRDDEGVTRNQTHFDFADDEVGAGKTWDGSYRKLLKDGWIRKVADHSYHVGHESLIPKVLDHVRKHHPEVETARVMVHPGPVLRTQREHLRFVNTKSGEVYEATEEPVRVSRPDEVRAIAKRAKLDIGGHDIKQLVMGMKAETEHDKPGDTDVIKGSKTARAEKLLKVALAHVREKGDYYTRLKKVEEGAGRGNWLDTRDAGWIAPDDTYHKLSPGEVHDRWIKNNGNLLATTGVKPDAFGYDKRAIIGAGWIQKHAANVYSAHDKSAVPRVVKHFTERHPEVKRVMVSFKTGGNVYVTRDGTVKEPIPYRAEEQVQENWMRTREAAWVAPDDTVHPLRPGQFHMHWVMDNVKYHAPELVQTRNGGAIDATATEEAMLKHGWFKKQDKDMYHADPSSLGRVHKHFTTHHPEIANVHVSGAGRLGMTLRLFRDGRSEKLTYGVNENWLRSRKAAWLSPEGDVHPLEGEQYHATWVRHNYNKVPKSLHSYHPGFRMDAGGGVIRTIDDHATKERMLDHGWVRKQDVNIYTAHDPEASKKLILDHVRKHHPEVKRVRVTGKDFASQWWDVDHGKVTESWMHSRSAAWIDPEDNVHPLVGGQFHTDWIRANHYRIPAAHKRYYGNLRDGDGLDAYSTRDMMLGAGWIRKQDSNSYNVGDLESTRERIIKHVRQHHPRTERVRVNEPGKDSWIDILPEKVDEAWRGGPLDRWLATRTAGWIAPDHTYHQLNPGEHHREWSTNPRNSRHLRDVLGVIDPARHWDANVVQHEMMKQGWIRKLDHDQYLVGRRSMIAQALRHHERFHPHKNRVEVAVENYPAQGMLHRFYFQRDPNTREILPRRDWREKRRLRKSQQDRKWGSSA